MTKVLIVEDEELIGMLLEEMLANRAFEVVGRATTLAQAQTMATSTEMDIALLDISLHGEPVFPVAQLLAERNIPFVFTTGYGAAGLPTAWAGHPVFCKPYNMQELTETLAKLAMRPS